MPTTFIHELQIYKLLLDACFPILAPPPVITKVILTIAVK